MNDMLDAKLQKAATSWNEKLRPMLEEAILSLPEQQGQVTELMHFEGLDAEAVAPLLGMDAGAVDELHDQALNAINAIVFDGAVDTKRLTFTLNALGKDLDAEQKHRTADEHAALPMPDLGMGWDDRATSVNQLPERFQRLWEHAAEQLGAGMDQIFGYAESALKGPSDSGVRAYAAEDEETGEAAEVTGRTDYISYLFRRRGNGVRLFIETEKKELETAYVAFEVVRKDSGENVASGLVQLQPLQEGVGAAAVTLEDMLLTPDIVLREIVIPEEDT